MKLVSRILSVAVAVLLPSIGGAQTVPAATDTLPLTLEQAIARAMDQSQEIRLARSQVRLAESQVAAARSAALPQIDGRFAYTRTFASPFQGGGFVLPDSLRFEPDPTLPLDQRVTYLEDNTPNAAFGALGSLFGNLPFGQENTYTAVLTGSQTLWSGGRVGAALRIARDFLEASEYGLQEQTAEIELQVRTAYYRARLAQELATISQAALEQAERFLRSEQLRRDAGTGSELDVLRAQVSVANLQPQLVAATNQAQLATLDLKRLVDIPTPQAVALATPLEAERTAPELDTLALRAQLARRAAVAAQERTVSMREQQVRIARAGYLPSVNLSFNYGKQLFPSELFALNEEWRSDASATVAVSIPIFNGFRTRSDVRQAQVAVEQERLRLTQLRESVEIGYEAARGERERAGATIAARQLTVQQAQRVYDLTVLRYEQGLASQLEVSDARLSLLQARTNLAQAIADFNIANATLARALGTPMQP